jgi:serine/threonine protein kinase
VSRDRYELGELLGSGHFSTGVYRAVHHDLDRQVAVKLLELQHPDHRADLLAEGRRMAKLPQHDHIVKVLDAGDWDDDHVYLAVELCDGGSLEGLVRGGPLCPEEVCGHISDACRGLDALHRAGILHLDLRPANIMLNRGVAKIGDFGLARPDGEAKLGSIYSQHAAPELLLTHVGTTATDQYAMAMTLAHLLSDGRICRAPVPQPIDKRAWRKWPDLDALGINVPTKLRKVIKQATEFEPADRYQEIEGFKRALDAATPALGFRVGIGQLTSSDGAVTISWNERKRGYEVEVKVEGRRKGAMGRWDLSAADCDRYLAELVKGYAYPARRRK